MPHQQTTYEFGPYQLDLTRRVLTRDGGSISLAPKATELLILLVANAGQLVEKDELLREIWPDTFVEEANLAQNIFTLRRVLGDDRIEPRYIETVAKRGYRFIAPVRVMRVLQHQSPTGLKSETQLVPVPGNGRPVIAVLPFFNADHNSDAGSLTSSLTDSIINDLSRVPKIHVMSRSSVLRYKNKMVDPQQVGKELGAQAVLVGRITTQPSGMSIAVELVDTWTGWQLWGDSYNTSTADIREIQDEIKRQLISTLKLKLAGPEGKSDIARFTEDSEAYKSYLQGRHHWSNYTRNGIETAIGHFEQAIKLDPNYALPYAAIIDCYLRLATNYWLPDNCLSTPTDQVTHQENVDDTDPKVRLRFEWDWKSAERELRRANDLQDNYPRAHQWYAAYRTAQQLYEDHHLRGSRDKQANAESRADADNPIPTQIGSLELTSNEQVQVYCVISREQIDAGNYEAACRILRPWWSFGSWPILQGLNQRWCADLLFTCGELASCVASALPIPQGQRHGEELLSGSIAHFEQLGFKRRAAEARIELALCYYRQGLFDMGRAALLRVLNEISADDSELRSLALIRLAILERHAGRLQDALTNLNEASAIMERAGLWAICRCHIELASTFKDLFIAESSTSYFAAAQDFSIKSLDEFAAIGNHRYVAIAENNLGFLLLSAGSFHEAEIHLLRSRALFESFNDTVRTAQVNETLARLYIATEQFVLAQHTINRAIETLEHSDGEALLAEALTTNGLVKSKLHNFTEAKKCFEAAYRIAERCGDHEGAGRALLVMLEESDDRWDHTEKLEISDRLRKLLSTTQQTDLQNRVNKALTGIYPGHTRAPK